MYKRSTDLDKDAKAIPQRIDHLSTNSAEQFGLFFWDKKEKKHQFLSQEKKIRSKSWARQRFLNRAQKS